MHQLFKPIGEDYAGEIKLQFCIVLFHILYLEAKHICSDVIETRFKWQVPEVCQYKT